MIFNYFCERDPGSRHSGRSLPALPAGLLILIGDILQDRNAWLIGAHNRLDANTSMLRRLTDCCAPRPVLDADTFYWELIALSMLNNRTFRVRHFPGTMAPFGRENLWSSGLAWPLADAGSISSRITGAPPENAIDTLGSWLNPLLLLPFICLMLRLVSAETGPAWGHAATCSGGDLGPNAVDRRQEPDDKTPSFIYRLILSLFGRLPERAAARISLSVRHLSPRHGRRLLPALQPAAFYRSSLLGNRRGPF